MVSAHHDAIGTLFDNIPHRGKWDLETFKKFAITYDIDLYSIRDRERRTVLHIAAGWGRQSLVKDQIDNGAEIDAKDNKERTPLHYACDHAHKTVASNLIEAGADVHASDIHGFTAMQIVLKRYRNENTISSHHWRIVILLVNSGVDPFYYFSPNTNCFSYLKDASQKRDLRLEYIALKLNGVVDPIDRDQIIDKYLRVKHFFEIMSIGDGEEDCQLVQSIVTPRLVRSRLDTLDNITPLHRAAGYGFLKIAQILINAGADVNAEDNQGRIPLHNASEYGHLDMIRLLVENGSELNTTDNEGETPIHYAARSSRTSIPCECLKSAGASITIKNNAGLLPFDVAKAPEIKEILKIYDQDFVIEEIHEDKLAYPLNDLFDNFGYLVRESIERRTSSSSNRFTLTKVMLSEEGQLFQVVKRKMLETIGYHSGDKYSTYDIKSIELILNDQLLNRYRHSTEILIYEDIPLNEKLLFHGSRSIERILTQGFNERYADQNGMFGAGIYFALHSSKSNQYTFGFNQGCPEHEDKSCYVCPRELILAQVALGKCLISQEELPDYRNAPPTFNSVAGKRGPNLKYPEYAIYDGKLAYPSYVIKYYIKP